MIPYNGMDSRSAQSVRKKHGDEFNGMNRMCIECLDKQKERVKSL